MPKIMPCLWIDARIEEMVDFYVATFKDAEIHQKTSGPDGILTIAFRLHDQEFMALNGGPGPQFKFNESISITVDCKDQAEVDHYWNALTADGGEESMCGWLKDKFGLSWQVTPVRLIELQSDPDPEVAQRVTQAMLQMKKLVIADLEDAANAVPV